MIPSLNSKKNVGRNISESFLPLSAIPEKVNAMAILFQELSGNLSHHCLVNY